MNYGEEDSAHVPLENWRAYTFIIVLGIIFIIFAFRLFDYQILQYTQWTNQADINRTNEISIPTQRGTIRDRNGILLASNIPSYNIAITPAFLPDDNGDIQVIFQELSILINVPVNKGSLEELLIPCGDNLGINQMVAIGDTSAPFQPVLIECDVERDTAMIIQEKTADWPGVSVQIEPIRDYPTGDMTASIIGFLGPIPANQEEALRALGFVPRRDKVGYAGVEYYFEDILRGLPGRRVVEVDVAGQILRNIEAPIDPQSGYNITLTIDTRLQTAADAIFKDEVNFWNTYFNEIRISSGAAIAMNPQTGEILAMVSYPSYENNRLARFIPQYYYDQLIADSTQPLLNNAVGAELPAGSVFKIVTSVGALNEGVVTPDQVIQTPPKITVTEQFYAFDPGNAREFVDWNDEGFGSLDFLGGISNSSNVYFYKLGGGYQDEVPEGLGICRLGTYARALGYARRLGIELPDETDGLIPDPTWKRRYQGENWSTGDTYISSVGQGFMIATPLQILTSAAVIANNGRLMQPTVIREVTDGEGNVINVVRDEFGTFVDAGVDEDGNILSVSFSEETSITEVVYNENGFADHVIYASGAEADLVVASPFFPTLKWDLTKDAIIETYENPEGIGSCKLVLDEEGNPILTTVKPWVINLVQEGMRMAVTSGTLRVEFEELSVPSAGKTGTAEYCDAVALSKNLCIPGNWPSHAWTVAYAPFDNPEIVVIAFLYNGNEGASVAGPVVKRILEAYFELKSIDAGLGAQ
jgi:penicillin-binding protein 2